MKLNFGLTIIFQSHGILLSFTIASVLLLSLYYICVVGIKNSKENKAPPPQADGAWPIIGHLHLLGSPQVAPHRTLASMADRHGPIFTLKLAAHTSLGSE